MTARVNIRIGPMIQFCTQRKSKNLPVAEHIAQLVGLAKASGIETPAREDLARLDCKRKKTTSNQDWKHPWDPDAKVAKMKDGGTHLAHKAEHAVELDTSAIVAVTLQGADQGDTTTLVELASIPEPVDSVGNALDRLTANTVAQ